MIISTQDVEIIMSLISRFENMRDHDDSQEAKELRKDNAYYDLKQRIEQNWREHEEEA